jgi:hypothetical protein
MPSSSTARSTAVGPTVTGDLVGVRSDATQRRISTTSSGEGRGKEDLYRQHSPSILPSRLASPHPIPAAQPISIIQSSPRPNPSANFPSRSSTSSSSSRSSCSSSYSSPFHDNGDRPASSSDPITAISTQLQNLASLGGGAFALPSSSSTFSLSPSSHPPTSTVTPGSRPSNVIASGDGDKVVGGGLSARKQGSSTSSFSDLSSQSINCLNTHLIES